MLGVRVAKVEEVAAEDPVGMILPQPAFLVADALGFEPDDELLALRMQLITEGAEAMWVAL